MRAFVVNDADGPIVSAESIRAKIDFSNIIFSQIGISLDLISVSNNVGSVADLSLAKELEYTNSSGRVYWGRSEQATALLNTYSDADCLELYFVKEITNPRDVKPRAFQSPFGVVISQSASAHVVAHEIGHALGLEDCYIVNNRLSPPVFLAGITDHISSSIFDDAQCDWGFESGRGFYPADETIGTTLQWMLMYGEDVGDSLDIPSGSVYSLKKKAWSSNETFSSKAGANFIKPNITEVYSR